MMSFSRRSLGIAIAAVLALAPLQEGLAQGTDPADLAFWQAISGGSNPDEYRAYLQAFPNGRFAGLARVRSDPAKASQPVRPPAPTPGKVDPVDPVEADPDAPSMTITPANGRVGQHFVITLRNFPEMDTRDLVVVVRAGTPVMPPTAGVEQTKILWSGYAANAKRYNGTLTDVGPFAPGRYDVRWMSVLYNDAHDYELKATVSFTVR